MSIAMVARVVLGVVLLWSGALKFVDADWPAAAESLGVPRVVARTRFVLFVPTVELVVGASLVVGLAMPLAGWIAVGLLVVFTAALVVVLIRHPVGDRPRCACFGSRSSTPVSWRTVARNLGLVGLGVLSAIA